MSHLHRTHDPQTSVLAAQRALAFRESHEARICRMLSAFGGIGATYREIAHACGMEPVAVARRLKGMEARGMICRSGHTRNGMTLWLRRSEEMAA